MSISTNYCLMVPAPAAPEEGPDEPASHLGMRLDWRSINLPDITEA